MMLTAHDIKIFRIVFKEQLDNQDWGEYVVPHYEYLSLYGDNFNTNKDLFVTLDINLFSINEEGDEIEDGFEAWFSVNHINSFYHDFKILFNSQGNPHFRPKGKKPEYFISSVLAKKVEKSNMSYLRI